jgi:hypothetical protein
METLRIYGSDLSRWPEHLQAAAREALLSWPELRREWERERASDRALATAREGLDREIAQSGAALRIRRHLVSSLPGDPLAGLPWASVAAAVLVAGMLGGALDLVLPEPPEQVDLTLLDPLEAVDIEAR